MFAIETERIRLRCFHTDDIPAYFALIHSDAEVMRYITGSPLPWERSVATVTRFIAHHATHGYSVWAATEKENGTLIGHGGLITLPNGSDVEVDYGFGRAHWGKGYATEVAQALLRFGLEDKGLPQIYGLTFPDNSASQRVLQKVGMRFVGRTRHFYNLDLDSYIIAQGQLDTAGMVYQVTTKNEDI